MRMIPIVWHIVRPGPESKEGNSQTSTLKRFSVDEGKSNVNKGSAVKELENWERSLTICR